MLHILAALAMFLLIAPAHACRTSGPPGPDDCGAMARQAEEQLHQDALRHLKQQMEYEQKQQELDAWRSQRAQRRPNELGLPKRPSDLPVILSPGPTH